MPIDIFITFSYLQVINRDCDDEDDCGSAADVFRTKGNKDKMV